ncbi:uncharacterized protein LOC129342973 [Eublepharis macularius]|uniref:Uncharacterized protein LOC129342973 n=1 Tax=Eublepharis macularius TaxID=481883 RepID=A0AA97KGQ0_EUBMA|nr:uncharacterized protein LOC129342973 [Eublepharis macularius]
MRPFLREQTREDTQHNLSSLALQLFKAAFAIKRTTEKSRTAMPGTNSKQFMEKDLAELKASLERSILQKVLADIDKESNVLKNTTLDIAFTGVSGAGKSSLVNAFRNISDFEEGAAKTGVKQTTMDPEPYSHPTYPELTLWDLPGIGTREFKPKEYLQKVNFSRYDFFIIVASERFTDHDTMLASEIKKMQKKFYFVRTKVDQAIEAERRKPNFSEMQTLEEIRKYCLCNLKEEGADDPRVFLISSWYLSKYDFPLLQKTLAGDLNDIKRPLLIMAMPAFSRKALQEKKAVMEAVIWKKALLSCGVGAIPMPGLSLAFDIGLLVTTMKEFCKAFGLDEDSLRNLAKRVGKPVEVLKSAVKKSPMSNQINPEFVQSLTSKSLLCCSAMVLEELSDFIPVLGSLVGGVNSFATTRYMLNRFLDDALEDAENLLTTEPGGGRPSDPELSMHVAVVALLIVKLGRRGNSGHWADTGDRAEWPYQQQSSSQVFLLDHHLQRCKTETLCSVLGAIPSARHMLGQALCPIPNPDGTVHRPPTSLPESLLLTVIRAAMAGTNSKKLSGNDLAELKASLERSSIQKIIADADKELKLLKNTTLDIAFTGVSGAGKSSLVNAFRNISDDEEGAAKTGVKQTTMDPEPYPHPSYPELTLWDLPGIGTREFKPKEYLQKVNFSRYDFFIIVASERFTDHDTMLASEIKKMQKKFYFVRTKVDQAIDAERRKPNFSETQTLEEIRKYCLCNLKEEGADDPRVFLISSWYLSKYDFPLLQKTLAGDLNDIKRPLLIMAMPAFSRKALQEKKAAMEAVIWKKALLSCGVGVIPMPGLSLAFDIGLLVTTMKEFCKAFGLDEDSLRNLAKRVGKPVEVLKSAVKKSPMSNQINPEFVQSLSAKSLLCCSAMVLEELSDFIPVFGSLVGGVNSFATTYYMLKCFLDDALEDAENLLATVAES